MTSNPTTTRVALQNLRQFMGSAPTINATAASLNLSFSQLLNTCSTTANAAVILENELIDIFSSWTQITPDAANVLAQLTFRKMLSAISHAVRATETFKTAANSLYISVNASMGDVNAKISSLSIAIAADQQQLMSLQSEISGLAMRINQLNEEASGAKGFFRGLAEGLSLGIWHEPTDEIAEAKRNYWQYTLDLRQLTQVQQQKQHDIQVLQQAQQAMGLLGQLNKDAVSFENALQNLAKLAAQTEHDGERAIAPNEVVAVFFRKRFDGDMQVLIGWRNVFNAA